MWKVKPAGSQVFASGISTMTSDVPETFFVPKPLKSIRSWITQPASKPGAINFRTLFRHATLCAKLQQCSSVRTDSCLGWRRTAMEGNPARTRNFSSFSVHKTVFMFSICSQQGWKWIRSGRHLVMNMNGCTQSPSRCCWGRLLRAVSCTIYCSPTHPPACRLIPGRL